jgi:transposase
MKMFVGIDWGREMLWVALVDERGKVKGVEKFENGPSGVREMIEWILEVGSVKKEEVGVAVETRSLYVVHVLLDKGFRVFTLDPKAMNRLREIRCISGAKSDQLDCIVLGDALRMQPDLFEEVQKEDEIVVLVREYERTEERLKIEVGQSMNRITEYLTRYFPNFLTIASSLDCMWVWELWNLCKGPRNAKNLSKQKVQRILQRYNVRTVDADRVMKVLSEQEVMTGEDIERCYQKLVKMEFERMRMCMEQIKRCRREIQSALEKLEKNEKQGGSEVTTVEIVSSLPGAGNVVVACLIGEAYRLIKEADYKGLRLYSGLAPVTRQSGKMRKTFMRRSCNSLLRFAMYHCAKQAMLHSKYWREKYHIYRARGDKHGTALRKIGDKLLYILAALIRTRTLYNEEKLKNSKTEVNKERGN